MSTPLSDREIENQAASLSLWSVDGDFLLADVECASFAEAIEFVNLVASVAERIDHHPDIDIRWRRVTLRLTTHSRGGRLTDLDFAVAREIERQRPGG